MVIWPPIESWVIRPRDGSLWATWHKALPSDHGNRRSGTPGSSKCRETRRSCDLGVGLFYLGGGGLEVWRRNVGEGGYGWERRREGRPPSGHSRNLSRHPARKSGQDNISKLRHTQTWKESPRGRPPECSKLHKPFFSPSFFPAHPAAPPLFFSFSFCPSLHTTVFQRVFAVRLGQRDRCRESWRV